MKSAADYAFYEELNMLFLHMMGEVFLAPDDDPPPVEKLTHSQGRVMLYIALRGAQRMSDIARLLGVTLPSATAVVNTLVEMKLVRRKQDARDRRVIYIEHSAGGKRLHEEMTRIQEAKLKKVFAHLTGEQRNEALNHLRQFVAFLKTDEKLNTHPHS